MMDSTGARKSDYIPRALLLAPFVFVRHFLETTTNHEVTRRDTELPPFSWCFV